MDNDEQITLSLGQLFASKNKKRREYRCRFVKAGRIRRAGNSPSNIVIEASALQAAVMEAKFDARAVFIDHAGLWEGPSLRNLAGVTSEVEFDEKDQAVYGVIKLYNEAAAMAGLLDELLAEGQGAPDIGLSIVFWPVWDLTPRPSPEGEGIEPSQALSTSNQSTLFLNLRPKAASFRLLAFTQRVKALALT